MGYFEVKCSFLFCCRKMFCFFVWKKKMKLVYVKLKILNKLNYYVLIKSIFIKFFFLSKGLKLVKKNVL